jgi:SNF2 family DNA or RNA helicase
MMRHVDLSREETALYEALRRSALERIEKDDMLGTQKAIQIVTELMKLRRACCHPDLVAPELQLPGSKLAVFGELLDELLENRHKALVFSQFVDHLALVRAWLDERGIRYQYLDGGTPMPERKRRVDAFQRGEGDVFLISLKAGGTGLNLTAADYVIHLDPWWNPAVEDQASDRAHRIGQQRPVTIYRLIARHTVEEGIVELHKRKRELADSLLEGSEAAVKLSPNEMLELLRLERSRLDTAAPIAPLPWTGEGVG